MKEVIGFVTVALTIIGHAPYVRDTYLGRTKPHVFTWLIWSIVVSVAFFGQFQKGGGAGSWSTGVTGLIVILIAIMSFRNHDKGIFRSDVIFFVLAISAIIPWLVSRDPTFTVIMATLIDAFAFFPTIRKTLKDPGSETLITYSLNVLRHGLSLFAIANYNLATVLYPTYLLLMNTFVTIIILQGKRK